MYGSDIWLNTPPFGQHTCCSGQQEKPRGYAGAISEVFGHLIHSVITMGSAPRVCQQPCRRPSHCLNWGNPAP